ncbi:MAG: UbiA family prenyltransferase [bacterium]
MRGRYWGHRCLGSRFQYLLFLRPRQWPILTCQLLVSGLLATSCSEVILGKTALPAGTAPVWQGLLAWFVWVVCLNGGTLAFNSAYDQDEGDVAYLRAPPPPPAHLVSCSLFLMLVGIGLAFLVSAAFGWITALCGALSIVYSHPRTRWKGIAGADLGVNMVGYGGCTTLAGIVAGQTIMAGDSALTDPTTWYLVAGFGLLFGSCYPLTQIYQLDEDQQRGDRTLVAALGLHRSLWLAVALTLAAAVPFYFATAPDRAGGVTWPHTGPLLAFFAWLVHLGWWLARAERMGPCDHERGMYRALGLWAVMDISLLASRYGGELLVRYGSGGGG